MPTNPQSVFWWPVRTLRAKVIPDVLFTAAWVFVIVAHASEGLYMTFLARKHRMPWNIGVRALSSLVLATM